MIVHSIIFFNHIEFKAHFFHKGQGTSVTYLTATMWQFLPIAEVGKKVNSIFHIDFN